MSTDKIIIGDVASTIRGVTYEKQDAKDAPSPGYTPLLRATNIDTAQLSFDGLVFVPNTVVKDEQRLRAGDIVLAASSGSLSVVGKAALLRHPWPGTFGAFCYAVRPKAEAVVPDYLAHFMQTSEYRSQVSKLAAGVNINNLRREHIESIELPFVGLQQQQRVVEAVDSYLSRLDAAVANLERVQAKLKAYRASVLKAAVEGRLVPTEAEVARQEKRAYEPAEALLARILKDRRRRWEEAELARLTKAGKAPKDNKWKDKYEDPTPPDTSKLPELPEGWCWTTLPQLGELNRGKSKHRPRNDPRLLGGQYPFVQTGDVRKADTWLRQFDETYSDFGLAQSRLWPAGTMCITIAANIAETAILNFDACFPDSVVGFLTDDTTITRYVEMFIRTAKQRLDQYAPATAQKNINLDTLSKVAVPLPPLAEQVRMVEELDRLLSVAATVASAATNDQRRSVRLRQAVLKWAFEGKLVDQDPADEPADKLLARIRAERRATGPTKKTTGRKAKAAS